MDRAGYRVGDSIAVDGGEAQTQAGTDHVRTVEAILSRSEGEMSAKVQRPLWSLVAESFQDAARERGLIDPAGRCLPPPFGCGEKPANLYGLCIDCIFELREEF